MKQAFGALAAIVIASTVSTSWAQHESLAQREVGIDVESGPIFNRAGGRGVIYSTQVQVPGAPWIRLKFDEVVLGQPNAKSAGKSGGGGAATLLRLTSAQDGAVQLMNSMHLQQWSHTSAYFNGDTVLIEIIANANAAPSRLSMKRAWVGALDDEGGIASICFSVDDRVLSDNPAQGRLVPFGCTAWMFNDLNRTFLTAGHCETNPGSVVEFNVPLSTSGGVLLHPDPEDQYPVDLSSVQFQNAGVGNDWKYFGCFPNTTTGLTPYQAQGAFYTLASAPPVLAAPPQPIRLTGYGRVFPPVSATWNQVQKTHVGPYVSHVGTVVRYQADTTGGDSGSPVVDENQQLAFGIHTHGECSTDGGSNLGTAINQANLVNAVANPLGVCAPPAFSINAKPASLNACALSDAVFAIDIGIGSDPAAVTLSVSGMPVDAIAAFSVNPVTPGGSSTLTISNLAAAAAGPYILQIEGTNGSWTIAGSATLDLSTAVPEQVALVSPSVGEIDVVLAPTFTWDAAPWADAYLLEVATNRAFSPVIYSAQVDGTSHGIETNLTQATLHWWRVTGSNVCGDGDASVHGSFTTVAIPRPCPADVQTDGVVDIDDLLLVIQSWGVTGAPGSTTGDVTGDGIVDLDDLLGVINAWGPCR